ncbi:YadA-like family protein [Pandoraea pnomenusa]|uniref:YadA-like family protein n=1 Tax=Pandoraea pnomenusa TaxID=93220 RepID=UPI001CB906F4|nr:YadA-like family protein [Pandoraea pnomenusa]
MMIAYGTDAIAGQGEGCSGWNVHEAPVAIGAYSIATANFDTALGAYAAAGEKGKNDKWNTAIGTHAFASHAGTGLGASTRAVGDFSAAVGHWAQAEAEQSLALGYRSKATSKWSVALGAHSTTSDPAGTKGVDINGVAYTFAGVSPEGTVSVGTPDYSRTITNVAAGRINETSLDAINGSQLSATNRALSEVNTDLSTFKIRMSSGQTAAELNIVSLSSGINSLSTAVRPAIVAFENTVHYDDAAHQSVSLGDAVARHPVLVRNVADAQDGTDAVNLRQLLNTNGTVRSLSTGVDSLSKDMSSLSTGLNMAMGLATDLERMARYDDDTHEKLTLGRTQSSRAVKLTNVADGMEPSDAVTTRQLKLTDGRVASLSTGADSLSSGVSALFTGVSELSSGLSSGLSTIGALAGQARGAVLYDDDSQASVTLGHLLSLTPVKLTNVADGVDASDAVTVGQLSVTTKSVRSLSTSTALLTTGMSSLSTGMGKISALVSDMSNVVHYDDDDQESVTFGNLLSMKPVTLTNVADGTGLSDAVTVRQLSQTNSHVNSLSSGAVATTKKIGSLSTGLRKMVALTAGIETSVQYDDDTQESVTFGNLVSTKPVILANVAEGVNPTDAVNMRQMSATNRNVGLLSTGMAALSRHVSSLSTGLSDIAELQGDVLDVVKYDNAIHSSVTLGGRVTKGAVKLTNVADAERENDAVNFGQLSATTRDVTSLSSGLSTTQSNLALLSSGTQHAITYDDTTRELATLGGVGAKPVKLTNLADGESVTDAVTFGQLRATKSHVASVASHLDSRVGSLSTGMATLADGALTLAESLTSLSTSFDSHAGSVSTGLSTTKSHIASLTRDLDGRVSSLSSGVATLADGALTLAESLTSLSTGFDSHAGSVSTGLSTTNSHMASLTRDLDGRVGSLSSGVATLADGALTLAESLTSLSTSFDSHAGSVSTGLSTTNSHIASLASDLDGRVVSLSTSFDAHAVSLSTGALTLAESLTSLSTSFDSHASSLSTGAVTLAESMTSLSTSFDSHASSLSTGLSTMSSNLALLSGGIEHAITYDDGTRERATLGGAQAKPVKLTNLADGENATDAVTFGQLSATKNQIASVASDLDGRVVSLSTGAVTFVEGLTSLSTSFESHAISLSTGAVTLAESLTSLSTSFDSHASSLSTGLSTMSSNLALLSGGIGHAITYDDETRELATLGGAQAKPVKLTNLADGESTTDAVTFGQLSAAKSEIASVASDLDGRVGSLSSGVATLADGALTLAESLTSLSTSFDSHAGSVSTGLSTTNSHMASLASDLDGRVGSLSSGVATLADGALTLAESLTSLSTSFDSHASSLSTGAATLAESMTSLSTSFDSHASSLSTGLSTMSSNLALLSGGIEHAITYDDGTRERATLGGAQAKPVKLTNLADGESTTDAVTFGQLSTTNSHIASLTGNLVSHVDSLSTGVVSLAQGLTSLSTGFENRALSLSTSVETHAGSLSSGLSTMESNLALLSSGMPHTITYDDTTRERVTLGGAQAKPVKLTNLADGESTTDAVTFGQLSTTNSHITSLTGNLVSHVDSLSTGVLSLAQGLTSLSTGFENRALSLSTSVETHAGSLSSGLSTMESNLALLSSGMPHTITYDDTTRERVTLGGAQAKPVKLTNLADGENTTDAVTFGQLSTTNSHIASLTGNLVSNVDSLSTGAMALTEGLTSLSAGLSQMAELASATENFVQFDDERRLKVTLGGRRATKPVSLSNVADGTKATDAVTVRQLSVTNSNVMQMSTGMANFEANVASLSTGVSEIDSTVDVLVSEIAVAVQYDNAAKTKLRLGGLSKTPVSLGNVAEGLRPNDAVNVAQLGATNSNVASLSTGLASLIVPSVQLRSGKGRKHRTFILGGVPTTGENNADGPVTLTNVADGFNPDDVASYRQLVATNSNVGSLSTGMIEVGARVDSLSTGLGHIQQSVGAIETGAVLYDDTTHATLTLGGTTAKPSVRILNVADGVEPSDAVNFRQLSDVNDQSASQIALVDDHVAQFSATVDAHLDSLSTGLKALASLSSGAGSGVVYDDDRRDKVTFGDSGVAPVALTNVADGAHRFDAVNFGQLSTTNNNVLQLSTGMTAFEDSLGSLTSALGSVDGTVEKLVSEAAVAVQYDTPNRTKLRLGGLTKTPVLVANVAAGVAPTDAVNAGQLAATNSDVASLSTGLAGLITPDTALRSGHDVRHPKLLLGGRAALHSDGSPAPVTLDNVADGEHAGEAVNFGQLSATNSHMGSISTSIDRQVGSLSTGLRKIEKLAGEADNGVFYDDASHSTLTLGDTVTAKPVTLTNLADGAKPSDAVTFRQLSATNRSVDALSTGLLATHEHMRSLSTGMTRAEKRITTLESNSDDYVGYDGQARDTLTLGDSVSRRAVRVRNVADGVEAGDAVNVAQLSQTNRNVGSLSTGLDLSRRALTSLASDVEHSARYDDASRSQLTLGGTGATAPVTLTNLADGKRPADAVNYGQLSETNSHVSSLSTGLSKLASMSPSGSQAVRYDDPMHARVTLGGADAHSGVVLGNLAAGVAGTDAVNVSQLRATDSRVTSLSTAASTGISDALSAVSRLASRLAEGTEASSSPVAPGEAGVPAVPVESMVKASTRRMLGAPAPQPAPASVSYVGVNDNGAPKGNLRGEGASGKRATAIGIDAVASGESGVALGESAKASGMNATAIGHAAAATQAGAVALGEGAMASGANAVAIGANAVASEPGTVSIGAPGTERRLTHLAPGRRPTDAATVGQLAGMQAGIDQVAKRAYSGIAAATALAMIPEVDPGKRVALGVGTATFQGRAATSIGASVRFTDNLKARLGVGISGQGNTYAAGVSYQW